MIDSKSNHKKNVLHGFFLSLGTTIAEPATILPIIINYFSGSSVVVGIFSSLLRGGAIAVQLYAAFWAQSYTKVIKYLRIVFFIRFLAWFLVGISILVFGKSHPNLTLWLIGIGFFMFSFVAGFGMIYFKEITAKIFSHSFRGYTMSVRGFYTAFGALISGAVAGWVLQSYEAPYSFGYLFVISSFVMAIGFVIFGSIDEPIKENVSKKEKSFKQFLQNSLQVLKSDKKLQIHVVTFLSAYSYLLGLPFIIIDASSSTELSGTMIGYLITSQMIGAMLSNILWAKLSKRGLNTLIVKISVFTAIVSFVMAIFANEFIYYLVIFFLLGGAIDGGRISSSNLIIIISPEDKRPVYSAIAANITSFGLFFAIIGGMILKFFSYDILFGITIVGLSFALFMSTKLQN